MALRKQTWSGWDSFVRFFVFFKPAAEGEAQQHETASDSSPSTNSDSPGKLTLLDLLDEKAPNSASCLWRQQSLAVAIHLTLGPCPKPRLCLNNLLNAAYLTSLLLSLRAMQNKLS